MEKSAQIFCILEGILMAIVGILFFIKPMDSLLYFTIVAGILIIGSGIFTIIKAHFYRFLIDDQNLIILNCFLYIRCNT